MNNSSDRAQSNPTGASNASEAATRLAAETSSDFWGEPDEGKKAGGNY